MSRSFVFTTTTELVRIPAESLIYVKADGNYSTMTVADGNEYVLTMQLGQIEHRIAESVDNGDTRFIRIGKSLIVNLDYVTLINPAHGRLIISDCKSFRHEVSASRDALRSLKDYVEKGDA